MRTQRQLELKSMGYSNRESVEIEKIEGLLPTKIWDANGMPSFLEVVIDGNAFKPYRIRYKGLGGASKHGQIFVSYHDFDAVNKAKAWIEKNGFKPTPSSNGEVKE